MRSGSGRRGGSTVTSSRHVRYFAYGRSAAAASCVATGRAGRYVGQRAGRAKDRDVDAVGQRDERDHLARRRLLERVAEEQRRVRGAGLADARGEIVGDALRPEPRRHALHRPRVRTGDDRDVDLVCAERGRLERGLPCRVDERLILGLAEALLPLARARVARCAPPVDELLGSRRAREVLGDHRAVGVVADEDRGGAVSLCGLVGARRQTDADVGGRRPAPCRGCAARRAGCRCPTGRRRRCRSRRRRRRAAARRESRWRWSSRDTRGRRWRTTAPRDAPASSAGSRGRPPPPWWWCPRRRTRPTGCRGRRPYRRKPQSRIAEGAGTVRSRRR